MTSEVTFEARSSVYQAITEKIAAAVREGASDFTMPWHGSGLAAGIPINAATKARYRGINILALWVEASARGYPYGYWASYRQWQSLGAQVRAGQKGSMIVFYKATASSSEDEDEEGYRPRYYARASRVFNVAQVDGWPVPAPAARSTFQAVKEADAFVWAIGADVRHGCSKACYRRDLDCVELPDRQWFVGSATSTSTESYYATLLHELTHWSGAAHRLNREFGKRYGDHAYSFEELIAELGAAFLCAALGIGVEPRPDHAAYIASWLQVFDRDPRAIFTAASQAQQAAEFLSQLAARKAADDVH